MEDIKKREDWNQLIGWHIDEIVLPGEHEGWGGYNFVLSHISEEDPVRISVGVNGVSYVTANKGKQFIIEAQPQMAMGLVKMGKKEE